MIGWGRESSQFAEFLGGGYAWFRALGLRDAPGLGRPSQRARDIDFLHLGAPPLGSGSSSIEGATARSWKILRLALAPRSTVVPAPRGEFRELRGGGRCPRNRQGPGPSVGLLAHPTGRREVCVRVRWEGYQPAPAPVRGAPSSVKGKELGRAADGKEAKEEPQRHWTAP